MRKVIEYLTVLLALLVFLVSNASSETIKVTGDATIMHSVVQEDPDAALQAVCKSSFAESGHKIEWQVVSSGGRSCGSPNYSLGGASGQTAAGFSTSALFRSRHGYCQDIEERSCGDADGKGSADIDDVVYIIAFIFSGGPRPNPLATGDVDCSGGVDIDDAVYLIQYIFDNGPAPCEGPNCKGGPAFTKVPIGTVELIVINYKDERRTVVCHTNNSDREVQAVQLNYQIHGEVRDIMVESLIDGLEEFHGVVNGELMIGLLDLHGRVMIPSGESKIVAISHGGSGEIELDNTIVVARGGGRLTATVAKSETVGIPRAYALHQNYPNPFNPTTVIAFSLPKESRVKIEVYNIMGQRVVQLLNDRRPAGNHTVTWDGKNSSGEPAASGVYFYRIESGDFTSCRKMVLLK